MRLAAKLIGKESVADRLFGSLLADTSKARDLLAWRPVTTMDQQLRKMVSA
jgi:nucleoside-diphosphate-sugar epimerase